MIVTILMISILVTLIAAGVMMFLGWPENNGVAGLILVITFACAFGTLNNVAKDCYSNLGDNIARNYCEILGGE